MVNIATDRSPESLSEVMQGEACPAGSHDEHNNLDERNFIQSVLDSMADENLNVLSKEELKEIILEMEKAAEVKALPAMPFPDAP